MISTALDRLEAPPSSRLLGWRLLDARPGRRLDPDRLRRQAASSAIRPGFIQGGILSGHARRHHGCRPYSS